MHKKSKVLLLVVITALVLVLPLAAQNVTQSLGSLASDTKIATVGLYKTDVDNYMDVARYSRVNFEKRFGFISGGLAGTIPKLQLGYATNLGSLYLGAFYQGNVVQVNQPGAADKTTTLTPVYDNDSRELLSTTKTTNYEDHWVNSANQIELLLGVANQGFKLGFYESIAENGKEGRDSTVIDYKDGRVDYSDMTVEYEEMKGYLRPYLGWGTDMKISDKLRLRPYLNFDLEIFNDKLTDTYSNYTKIRGKKQDKRTAFDEGHSNGYLAPIGQIGAKVDVAGNKGSSTLDVSYKIDLRAYKNDAEATGFSGDPIKGTVGWESGEVKQTTKYYDHSETNTDITLNFDERKWARHTIAPSYTFSTSPATGFSIGFTVLAPITVETESSKQYSETHEIFNSKYAAEPFKNISSKKLTRTNNPLDETTTTSATLQFNVGTQYKFSNERLTLNAGIIAVPAGLSHKVAKSTPNSVAEVSTEVTKDGNGNVITDSKSVTPRIAPDSVSVTNTWDQFAGGVAGGFSFNFTPKIALDTSMAASITNRASANNFKMDITEVHVLLSLKK